MRPTHVSFVFVDLPNTLPLIFGDALFFFSLEICTLLILSFNGLLVSGSTVGFVSGDVLPGSVSSSVLLEELFGIFLQPWVGILSISVLGCFLSVGGVIFKFLCYIHISHSLFCLLRIDEG